MTLRIRLLGTPGADRDGAPVAGVRGRKAWAVLGYLLLADAPVPRSRLARTFFPDAGDPAATLRWNLSQLRRHLGVELTGDPVTVLLPDHAVVDAHLLRTGDSEAAVALPGLGEDLLAGPPAVDGAAFEVWLEGERRHLRALSADVLRDAALRRLAGGDPEGAVSLAERVMRLEPLDENAAVLLVRALRATGAADEAHTVASEAADRIRRELGVEPTAALRAAVHAGRSADRPATSGRLAVEADLEAGEAALTAGVVDAGIDLLREALGGARAIGDQPVLARALTRLGSALIHAVRGTDQDAVALLHEAVSLRDHVDDPAVLSTALRELGYVELLRARYPRARVWFTRAAEAAGGDLVERAWIDTFAGAAATDVADYPRATHALDAAVEEADAADQPPLQTMARAMRGRLRLLAGDVDGASDDLDVAVAMGEEHGLRAVVPWPATMRAEVDRRQGDLASAEARLERAYVVSRQVGDPCWEAMALRGLGLVHAGRGELRHGVELLESAPRECRRLPDTYRWIEAYALDALTALGLEHGLDAVAAWARDLDETATAYGMRELSLSAARHRAALGEPGAAELVEARAEALAARHLEPIG